MRLVNVDKFIKDFPIRLNHYDKENGSKHFVLGIEVVLDSLDCTPPVDAIPVEWLKRYRDTRINRYGPLFEEFDTMLEHWRKENE